MADADASAAFELEDDSLSAGLDAVAAKFAAIATQINAGFAGANAQLAATAVHTASVGAGASLTLRLGQGLMLAARAAQMVSTAMAGIVMTATRLAPWVKYIPDSLGSWVPKIKPAAAAFTHVSAQIGTVVKSAQALTGRLSVLNAGFLALELRELGASKGMAVFGAAGALATSKIIAGARSAMGAVGSLGGAISGAARRIGGVGGMLGGLGRSIGTASMFIAPMAGMALALGPVGVAAAGVAAGFVGVKKSIASAAEIQTLQTGFITLLGSADKARARMAELAKFAADTPFEIPQVVKASKILETLTRGALSTGAGLRMVGDIASVAGQPFEEISVHVGRLYDGLMNGRPVGEAMQRLQELGLVSSATRNRLEDLQKSGAKGGAVWTVAAQDLLRFSGEMDRQSNTWSGVMSNVSDSIGQIFAAFGAPIITDLLPFMKRMQAWLQSLVAWAARAGTIFAAWSATIAQIFADGQMGQALVLVGKVAFAEVVNFLLGGLVGVGHAFMAYVAGAIKSLLVVLRHATTADFWKGLGNALLSAGQGLIALLLEGVAQVLDALRDVPGIGGKAGKAADSARDSSAGFADAAAANASQAGAQLSPLFAELDANMRNTFSAIGKAFSEGRASVGDVMDASGDKDALMKMLQSAWAKAKTDIAATAKLAEKGGLPAPVPGNADAAGDGKDKAGALQKVGGGGYTGVRDPVVAATNNVASQVGQVKLAVQEVTKTLTTFRRANGSLVFT